MVPSIWHLGEENKKLNGLLTEMMNMLYEPIRLKNFIIQWPRVKFPFMQN